MESNGRLGLHIFVTASYLFIGMFIFRSLELDNEKVMREQMIQEIQAFLANSTCVTMSELRYLVGVVEGDVRMARAVVENRSISDKWDYSGAMSFVATVVTTIGYGHLAPVTTPGRVVTVIYALIGIPLTLIMLKDIGDKLNNWITRLYRVQYCQRAWINRTINVSIVVFVGVNVTILLPSALFIHVEGWTMVDAVYYCFITLSTIGFGDFLLRGADLLTWNRSLYTFFIYIWVFIGLAYISLIISCISNTIVEKARSVERHTLTKVEAELRRLRHEMMKYQRRSQDITTNMGEARSPSTPLDVKLMHYTHVGQDNNAFVCSVNSETFHVKIQKNTDDVN
ncbi:potassium channel subfamily K member 16-like isoform X1 [Haliotis rubra]|uniref:potassium channel subfamily K member 16-like isoform X1 n=1 Tax=Haliotis rubra TaxID=36100 RepID=UPI001EE505BA|nr:potassium channel subfamily K member 16-like isoform X1 [Haliotis rubra]XP_046551829.1 potassium channel subfamily K member 16-like isoform X1 [Haliotis rubra]